MSSNNLPPNGSNPDDGDGNGKDKLEGTLYNLKQKRREALQKSLKAKQLEVNNNNDIIQIQTDGIQPEGKSGNEKRDINNCLIYAQAKGTQSESQCRIEKQNIKDKQTEKSCKDSEIAAVVNTNNNDTSDGMRLESEDLHTVRQNDGDNNEWITRKWVEAEFEKVKKRIDQQDETALSQPGGQDENPNKEIKDEEVKIQLAEIVVATNNNVHSDLELMSQIPSEEIQICQNEEEELDQLNDDTNGQQDKKKECQPESPGKNKNNEIEDKPAKEEMLDAESVARANTNDRPNEPTSSKLESDPDTMNDKQNPRKLLESETKVSNICNKDQSTEDEEEVKRKRQHTIKQVAHLELLSRLFELVYDKIHRKAESALLLPRPGKLLEQHLAALELKDPFGFWQWNVNCKVLHVVSCLAEHLRMNSDLLFSKIIGIASITFKMREPLKQMLSALSIDIYRNTFRTQDLPERSNGDIQRNFLQGTSEKAKNLIGKGAKANDHKNYISPEVNLIYQIVVKDDFLRNLEEMNDEDKELQLKYFSDNFDEDIFLQYLDELENIPRSSYQPRDFDLMMLPDKEWSFGQHICISLVEPDNDACPAEASPFPGNVQQDSLADILRNHAKHMHFMISEFQKIITEVKLNQIQCTDANENEGDIWELIDHVSSLAKDLKNPEIYEHIELVNKVEAAKSCCRLMIIMKSCTRLLQDLFLVLNGELKEIENILAFYYNVEKLVLDPKVPQDENAETDVNNFKKSSEIIRRQPYRNHPLNYAPRTFVLAIDQEF